MFSRFLSFENISSWKQGYTAETYGCQSFAKRRVDTKLNIDLSGFIPERGSARSDFTAVIESSGDQIRPLSRLGTYRKTDIVNISHIHSINISCLPTTLLISLNYVRLCILVYFG